MVGLERKYSNNGALLGVFCVLITCNSRLTVQLDGDRGAWLRRLILLNYDQKTHTKDIPGSRRSLCRKRAQEFSTGRSKDWSGKRGCRQDSARLCSSGEHRKRVEALLDESEGVRIFVTNHIKADPLSDITTEEILQHYAVYCGAPERSWYFNIKSSNASCPTS